MRLIDGFVLAARWAGPEPAKGLADAVGLDPVYTGKAMAGLIGLAREGFFKPADTVVFVHTGGTQALYAYRSAFAGV